MNCTKKLTFVKYNFWSGLKSFEYSPNILDHLGPVQNYFGPTKGPDISLPLIGRRLVYPNSCLLMQCVPNGNRYYWDITSEKVFFFHKLHCQYSSDLPELFYSKEEKLTFMQVNICQKLIFLHQLTLNDNMTKDCSWNYHEHYKLPIFTSSFMVIPWKIFCHIVC